VNAILATVLAVVLLAQQGSEQKPSAAPGPAPSAEVVRPEAPEYKTDTGVAYGDHPSQVIYVNYYPDGPPRPAMIYFHSGGFNSGPLNKPPQTPQKYLDLGLAFVVVAHRTVNEFQHPAQVEDAANAVKFIKDNAARWNIDPDRLAVTGRSAGGHLAMWIGFRPDTPDVACVVERIGPTDFHPEFIKTINPNLMKRDIFDKLFGEKVKDRDPKVVEEYTAMFSPVTYMSPDDPPTLFVAFRTPPPEEDPPSAGYGIHHHRFAEHGYERYKALGGVAELFIGERGKPESEKSHEIEKAFLRKHLLGGKLPPPRSEGEAAHRK